MLTCKFDFQIDDSPSMAAHTLRMWIFKSLTVQAILLQNKCIGQSFLIDYQTDN